MSFNEFHVKSFESLSIIFDTHTQTPIAVQNLFVDAAFRQFLLENHNFLTLQTTNVADVHWKLKITNQGQAHTCAYLFAMNQAQVGIAIIRNNIPT